MSRIEQLVNFNRRITAAKELTDLLVLEALDLCGSQESSDKINKKYVLVDLCHNAAWEQAAFWVYARCLPTWLLELRINEEDTNAKLSSPHFPALSTQAHHPRTASALLLALSQARQIIVRLGLENLA